MLLIGDLHINSRYHEKILTELKNIFFQYPEEKYIIFLGDYVYHFAYDRNALLQLYELFLDLFTQEKHIYILSGNHDRLGNSFVFEEAKKAFDILKNSNIINKHSKGGLHFITKPYIENIEGEKILFLPFFLLKEHKETNNNYVPINQKLTAIREFSQLLEGSNNKHEMFSGYINKYLAEQIDQHPEITIIHHYYVNNTIFPGQKSKFSYKDIALNEQFLELPNIKFISGHLHQGFTYKNYLCIGSVRSTNSLEINQNKYIFHYETKTKKMTALPININPQIVISSKEIITENSLYNIIEKINQANKEYYNASPLRNIIFKENQKIQLENTTLTVQVDYVDYEKIDEIIDPHLRKKCKECRLKKNTENLDEIIANFKIDTTHLTGFSDRKNILIAYMKKKFDNEYPKYEKTLKELKLL